MKPWNRKTKPKRRWRKRNDRSRRPCCVWLCLTLVTCMLGVVLWQSTSLRQASDQLAETHSQYLELRSEVEDKDALIKRLNAAQFASKTKVRKLESQIPDLMQAARDEGDAKTEALVQQLEEARQHSNSVEESLQKQQEEYETLLDEARAESRRLEREHEADGRLEKLSAEIADKDAQAHLHHIPIRHNQRDSSSVQCALTPLCGADPANGLEDEQEHLAERKRPPAAREDRGATQR